MGITKAKFYTVALFFLAIPFYLGRDYLMGAAGEYIVAALPDSIWVGILHGVVVYGPAVAFFALGVMALTGWGSNTSVHITSPHFRKKDGESIVHSDEKPASITQQQKHIERESKWRIPLTAFFKYAAENGWDFQQESLQIYDLLNGLKQAGFDGVVRFWGRENSRPFPTNENLLVQLTGGYWGTHTVEAISCMTLDDSGNAIGITETNSKIKTEDEFLNDNTGIYADIHLDRAQAEKWLKDETQNYIGKTRARMEARTNPSQEVSRISLAEAARRVYSATKDKFTAALAEHNGNIEAVYAHAFFRTSDVAIFGRAPSSQVFVQISKNRLADLRLSDDAAELAEDGPKGKRYVDLQVNESDLPTLVAVINGQPV